VPEFPVPETGNRKKERIVSGENNVVSPLGSVKQIHLMIRNEFVARFGAPAKRQWEEHPSWTTSDSAAAANNPPQTMCAAAAADSATTLSLNQL